MSYQVGDNVKITEKRIDNDPYVYTGEVCEVEDTHILVECFIGYVTYVFADLTDYHITIELI